MYFTVFILTLKLYYGFVTPQELSYLGAAPMDSPGFVALFEHNGGSDAEKYSIIVSTFQLIPGTTEEVELLLYPGTCLSDPGTCINQTIASGLNWPRQAAQVPEEVFGSDMFVHVTDGFIPPGKQDGTVYISDLRDQQNIILTDIVRNDSDEEEWFHQKALWKDGDGDGRLDMFTCRTRTQNIPSGVFSQFMWFKNPGGEDPEPSPWELGLLISENDCDTFFIETTLSVEDQLFDVIFTTGYFMNTLSVYWTAEFTWDNSSMISSRVIGSLIDDSMCTPGEGLCGHYFDIKLEDLNMDGNLDLVVTINSELYGHVVVYEIPPDFRTGEFIPIILAEGFTPRIGMANQGSPGIMQTFWPHISIEGKPWIVLSGDDDGRAYYMKPESQLPNNWVYELVTIFDGGADFTMGSPIAFDSDGDGYTELFIAVYSGNEIRFYSFSNVDV